ncbi:hypothetical protein CRG98_041507, partial [Punica granatum]
GATGLGGAPNPPRQAASNNPAQSARQDQPLPQHDPNVVRLDQLTLDVRVAVEAIIITSKEPQANLDDHAATNQRLNQAEDDVASSKHRPKSRHEGNSAKLPSNMPSLITPLPRPIVALSLEEVQRLIEEKVAKAIQAIERKQLSLPSPSMNLQSPLSQDILNTKLSRKFNFPQITP